MTLHRGTWPFTSVLHSLDTSFSALRALVPMTDFGACQHISRGVLIPLDKPALRSHDSFERDQVWPPMHTLSTAPLGQVTV